MNSDKRNEDMLREASALGDEDGVRTLIAAGADINNQHPVNGWTCLHWAAKRNRAAIVRLLLSEGANPTLKSVYNETALSLASNEEVRKLLCGANDICPEYQPRSPLPITPNYLANPAIAPKIEKQDSPGFNSRILPDNDSKRKLEEELVLKIRVADQEEKDFIEIEIPANELSYEKVLKMCCEELQVSPNQVLKMRKLPDTIVRKDKDVQRFHSFQELELVTAHLRSESRSPRMQIQLPNISFKDANQCINNNQPCSDATSPLATNSHYCKNGTILY